MKLTRLVAVYDLAVGLVLVGVGIASSSWWAGVLGVGLLALGLGTGFGRGESTSWLRGDLDERRKKAVDHAFRTAFFVLAWWVGGVAMYASGHRVSAGFWAAGNAVAVAAAYGDYMLTLRRI